MVLSKSFLPDGQGVVEQVRGLLVLVLVPVHEGEDVQHGGHVRMVVSGSLFKVLQGLLAQRYSNFIPTSKISIATNKWYRTSLPALTGILDHQVMKGSQSCWNLVTRIGLHGNGVSYC